MNIYDTLPPDPHTELVKCAEELLFNIENGMSTSVLNIAAHHNPEGRILGRFKKALAKAKGLEP